MRPRGAVDLSHCLPASLRSQRGRPLQGVNCGVTSAGTSSAGPSPGQSAGASPRQSGAQQAAAGTGVRRAGPVPDAQGQAMLRAAEGAPARQQQQVSQLQLHTVTAGLVPCRCKQLSSRLSGCQGAALPIAGDLLQVPRTARCAHHRQQRPALARGLTWHIEIKGFPAHCLPDGPGGPGTQ